jgi:hypothetical protein
VYPHQSTINPSKSKVFKNDENINHKKIHMVREKSKQKTVAAIDREEMQGWNKIHQTVNQSIDAREDKFCRK